MPSWRSNRPEFQLKAFLRRAQKPRGGASDGLLSRLDGSVG
jgi:hypothetical protein